MNTTAKIAENTRTIAPMSSLHWQRASANIAQIGFSSGLIYQRYSDPRSLALQRDRLAFEAAKRFYSLPDTSVAQLIYQSNGVRPKGMASPRDAGATNQASQLYHKLLNSDLDFIRNTIPARSRTIPDGLEAQKARSGSTPLKALEATARCLIKGYEIDHAALAATTILRRDGYIPATLPFIWQPPRLTTSPDWTVAALRRLDDALDFNVTLAINIDSVDVSFKRELRDATNANSAAALADYFIGHIIVTEANAIKALGITKPTFHKYVQLMTTLDLIEEITGRKSFRAWRIIDPILSPPLTAPPLPGTLSDEFDRPLKLETTPKKKIDWQHHANQIDNALRDLP